MRILPLLCLAAFAVCTADPVLDRTLDAPGGDITGLGYGNGSLWAVDRASKTIYELDPNTGSVSNSWAVTQTGTKIPTGMTFLNNYVYVCAGAASGTAAYGYRYTTSGSYVGSFSLDC